MTQSGWRLFRRAAVNLWRAPLPSLVAVITIALALFLAAALAASINSARALLVSWGAQPAVTAYLDRAVPDEEVRALAETVRRQERVQVVHVTPAQALDRLRVQLGTLSSALDGLPGNPLPATLEITPAPGADVRGLAGALVFAVTGALIFGTEASAVSASAMTVARTCSRVRFHIELAVASDVSMPLPRTRIACVSTIEPSLISARSVLPASFFAQSRVTEAAPRPASQT